MKLIEELEQKLDSFDADERKAALAALCEQVRAGETELPEPGKDVNLHCHTFFSYNAYGYSPSKFAWLARKAGLAVAGVVDFDVLDALEEFHAARRMLGLKGCAGMETRVFVPEVADKTINSPGEPGISYHMGVGFPKAKQEGEQQEFLLSLSEMAQDRNRGLMERVNEYLDPVVLDYEEDVQVLTPGGNATERHMCSAYARKAKELLEDDERIAAFWSARLGMPIDVSMVPESRELTNAIRAKTMKRGGVGYVEPDRGSFPQLAATNEFIVAAGAIPTWTWLDGTSDGESDMESLLDVAIAAGSAAINVIPDRNYTVGSRDEKLENLYTVIEVADRRNLPIVVGTEMNSPGQKFVDDFATKELSPLVPIFLYSAHVFYGHSVLQQQCGLGYMSDWAKGNFDTTAQKNRFFELVGKAMSPEREDDLAELDSDVDPDVVLKAAKG